LRRGVDERHPLIDVTQIITGEAYRAIEDTDLGAAHPIRPDGLQRLAQRLGV
jgi:hypothetical protein